MSMVQKTLSLQSVGVCWQPATGSQLSSVQGFPSLQSSGVSF